MSREILLNECLTTYTWGNKYCIEIFVSGKYYISYKKGHVEISEDQQKFFMKIIKDMEHVESKDSLFGKIIELPSSPRLNRWVMRVINQNLREQSTPRIDKENSVHLGKGKYIAKEDYNAVIAHYEAVKYGDNIEEGGS